MGISEEDLPGIGRRYELDVLDDDRLVAVVHRTGRRDLFAFRPGGTAPRGSVALDEESARQLAALLSGSYSRRSHDDPIPGLLDRFHVETLVVPDGSPIDGRTLAQSELRKRTGATVLAVIDGRESTVDPAPATLLASGDTLVAAGHPDALARLEALLAGELVEVPAESEGAP